MSRTTRNSPKREKDDWYPTPAWCVKRLVEAVPARFYSSVPLFDPCYGAGDIFQTLLDSRVDRRILGQDIKLRRTEAVTGHHVREYDSTKGIHPDLLARLQAFPGLTLITNPPFAHAETIIRKNRELLPQAVAFYLLRLNFLGSEERLPFFRADMPSAIYVLPNRPSFRADRQQDSIEYAWFCWLPGRRTEPCSIQLLGSTDTATRNRDYDRLFGPRRLTKKSRRPKR